MKVSILVFLALAGVIGSALAQWGGAGYQYVPVYPGAGYNTGYNQNSIYYMIGFLFLFLILIQSGLFNTTSTTNTTSPPGITFLSG